MPLSWASTVLGCPGHPHGQFHGREEVYRRPSHLPGRVSGRGLQAAASAQAVISGRVQQARRAAARRLPQFKRKVGGVFMVFTLRLFLENIVMRTAWVLT